MAEFRRARQEMQKSGGRASGERGCVPLLQTRPKRQSRRIQQFTAVDVCDSSSDGSSEGRMVPLSQPAQPLRKRQPPRQCNTTSPRVSPPGGANGHREDSSSPTSPNSSAPIIQMLAASRTRRNPNASTPRYNTTPISRRTPPRNTPHSKMSREHQQQQHQRQQRQYQQLQQQRSHHQTPPQRLQQQLQLRLQEQLQRSTTPRGGQHQDPEPSSGSSIFLPSSSSTAPSRWGDDERSSVSVVRAPELPRRILDQHAPQMPIEQKRQDDRPVQAVRPRPVETMPPSKRRRDDNHVRMFNRRTVASNVLHLDKNGEASTAGAYTALMIMGEAGKKGETQLTVPELRYKVCVGRMLTSNMYEAAAEERGWETVPYEERMYQRLRIAGISRETSHRLSRRLVECLGHIVQACSVESKKRVELQPLTPAPKEKSVVDYAAIEQFFKAADLPDMEAEPPSASSDDKIEYQMVTQEQKVAQKLRKVLLEDLIRTLQRVSVHPVVSLERVQEERKKNENGRVLQDVQPSSTSALPAARVSDGPRGGNAGTTLEQLRWDNPLTSKVPRVVASSMLDWIHLMLAARGRKSLKSVTRRITYFAVYYTYPKNARPKKKIET
eukprot:GEMP01029281.1.p1 GENE.GEMP01029281.1~~GEMP01029281.1.p1  ORF type:complete len:609 (+),score=147.85 GEMP01029281.1:225-2051(+)